LSVYTTLVYDHLCGLKGLSLAWEGRRECNC